MLHAFRRADAACLLADVYVGHFCTSTRSNNMRSYIYNVLLVACFRNGDVYLTREEVILKSIYKRTYRQIRSRRMSIQNAENVQCSRGETRNDREKCPYRMSFYG